MTDLVKDAEIALILPLYNKFAYGMRAAASFLKYTKRSAIVIAVDDASPHYPLQDWDAWRRGVRKAGEGPAEFDSIPDNRLVFKHFGDNAGLTRSWNWGLQKARSLGIKYAICGNSDIQFAPHWEHGLVYQADEGGYSLVGPITNAPGVTNGGKQRISHYFPNYEVRYDSNYLQRVSTHCHEKYPTTQIVPCNINGFFMLARTDRWWEGRFDTEHVFDPLKKMTGNEDELQRRWHKQGFKTGFVPSSFVFHHRAVSRGDRYKHTGWCRIDDIHEPI